MARKQASENKVVLSSSAAPVRHKAVAPKRAARPAAVEVSNIPASEPEVLPVAPAAQLAAPTESFQDAVARLAYLYWEARGCQGGSPEADWLRAEPEVLLAPAAQLAAPTESFQDAVARLAYLYWEARGCQGGSPEADWLRAERELSAQ